MALRVRACAPVFSSAAGDGTLLWTCHVFGNRAVPPLLPFNMGSLGFLTPFAPAKAEQMVDLMVTGE